MQVQIQKLMFDKGFKMKKQLTQEEYKLSKVEKSRIELKKFYEETERLASKKAQEVYDSRQKEFDKLVRKAKKNFPIYVSMGTAFYDIDSHVEDDLTTRVLINNQYPKNNEWFGFEVKNYK